MIPASALFSYSANNFFLFVEWQIHAPEVVIIKPHSDVCYICNKHHEALLRQGGGHPPFAEGRYSCCGSCWSREATTSLANGYLCWPLALLEQGDKALSSFWFANSMGEWRITCFIFGHNPLAICFSLWQNPLLFLYIPTLLFCVVCVPYHAWNGFKFCPEVFHIDVNSLQQKKSHKYPCSMVLAVCGSYHTSIGTCTCETESLTHQQQEQDYWGQHVLRLPIKFEKPASSINTRP